MEDVSSLHLARRWTQKLVSRELADGRARELYSVVSDMGVTSEQHHISRDAERARLLCTSRTWHTAAV